MNCLLPLAGMVSFRDTRRCTGNGCWFANPNFDIIMEETIRSQKTHQAIARCVVDSQRIACRAIP